MERRKVSALILALLIAIVSVSASIILHVESSGTIYIMPDGWVNPPEKRAFLERIPPETGSLYRFTVTINETISIMKDDVVVDGNGHTLQGFGTTEKGFHISYRRNVTIQNTIIKNCTYGIYVEQKSSSNTFSGNTLTANDYGIRLSQSSFNTFSGNTLTANDYGIYLAGSTDNIIQGNTATANNYSLYFSLYDKDSSDNNTVFGNTIMNSVKYGAYLEGSKYNVISENTITNSKQEGLKLIFKSDNNTISGNTLRGNNRGVLLFTSYNNTISGNTIMDSANVGISLEQFSDRNKVSGNMMTNNTVGVSLLSSSYNVVSENTIAESKLLSGSGIFLQSKSVFNNITGNILRKHHGALRLSNCNNNTVSKNMITDNTDAGIYLYWESNYNTISENTVTSSIRGVWLDAFGPKGPTQNTISGNTIASNTEAGIKFSYATTNTVSGNTITNNVRGLWLESQSSGNIILENTIANNTLCGVQINASSNKFYHNNFISNTQQHSATPEYVNSWHNGYPSGGNHWSDYTGVDLRSGPNQDENGPDGIGDTQYSINAKNNDTYPLMGPFGGVTLVGENSTVFPTADVCSIFEHVATEGSTTVDRTEVGPEPPSGFERKVGYYDIKTTATHTGGTRIKIVYDDSKMTQNKESTLQMIQWNETAHQWTSITEYIDTSYNVIIGETSHLSLFALTNELLHDINLTKVTPSKTVVGENVLLKPLNISVTVANQGDYTENNFNITVYVKRNATRTENITFWRMGDCAYFNGTEEVGGQCPDGKIDDSDGNYIVHKLGSDDEWADLNDDGIVDDNDWKIWHPNNGTDIRTHFNLTQCIGIQTVTNLEKGESETRIFHWNTTGFLKSLYNITAEAGPVPDEKYTADNVNECTVNITMVGDITGPQGIPDGQVDIRDIALIARGYGAIHVLDLTSPKYCQYWHSTPCEACPHSPNYDLNCDGKIDIKDIALVARNYGKRDP